MSPAKALQSIARLLRISEYDAIAIACDISCQKGLAPLFKYNFLNSAELSLRVTELHHAARLNRWYYYHIISIWSMPINSARGFV